MKKSILFNMPFLVVVGFGCAQKQDQRHAVNYTAGEVLPFPEPPSASVAGKN